MKILVLLFFCCVGLLAIADNNVLDNGDFSKGITHWEGDCHSPESNADDSSFSSPEAAPTTGVIIKLRHLKWTKVTQDFNAKLGQYLLTVKYSLSSDFKLSEKKDDYTNIPGQLDYTLFRPFDSDVGKWVFLLSDVGAWTYTDWAINPVAGAGVQTVTLEVNLDSDESQKKGFFLLFPPGNGTITLQSVSLTPK